MNSNLSPSEARTLERAKIQIKALRYKLEIRALKSLIAPERERKEREPRRLVKLEG